MNDDKLKVLLNAGNNIRLELLEDRHAEEAFALLSRNREHLGTWLPWVGNMQSLADFKAYINAGEENRIKGTDYGYMIFNGEKMAGRIGVHYIHLHNRSGAIGYWIGKEFEGKGIITQACSALLDHCFDDLGLNRIEIKCGVGNNKSAAIPQRLGFNREGILRQAERLNGGFIDLELFAILQQEWKARF